MAAATAMKVAMTMAIAEAVAMKMALALAEAGRDSGNGNAYLETIYIPAIIFSIEISAASLDRDCCVTSVVGHFGDC